MEIKFPLKKKTIVKWYYQIIKINKIYRADFDTEWATCTRTFCNYMQIHCILQNENATIMNQRGQNKTK